LTLSVGGRYTSEDKTFCQAFTVPDENGTVVDFEGVRKSPMVAWGSSCEASMLPALNNNFTDPVTGQPGVFDGTESWNEFTPKVGLAYDFSDTGMVYLSYTEGFHSGGFNGRATGAANAGPYEPEIVESWEFGFKTSWLDNTLHLNGAVFTADYQDKQEDVVLPGTDGAVTLTMVQNAAAASLDGFELESVWIPVPGLTLTANMGYLDASYDDYVVSDPTGLPLDKSGFALRKAPELNYAIGGTYEWVLAND
jgi:iron complex outermembrane recepter protein